MADAMPTYFSAQACPRLAPVINLGKSTNLSMIWHSACLYKVFVANFEESQAAVLYYLRVISSTILS
jgi:hypothetical protein